MAGIKGAQALLCRRMGICVVRRLLSVSEYDHYGGGDDVIPEVMMAFVIMIVVVMLSLMVLVPVTSVVMALVVTFFVLVSGLDNLSEPRDSVTGGSPIIISEFTPIAFRTPPRVRKTESSPKEATKLLNNRKVWEHTVTQDLRSLVYATGFGKFHGSDSDRGVRYGVLVGMMMFVVMSMIIVVVATMRLGERSLSMTTETTKQQQQQQQHNQFAEGKE
jgi:hypothetical protein